MKSLRQHMKSVGKFTSIGESSTQMCRNARFKILKSVQACAHHVMADRHVLNKDTSYGKKRKLHGFNKTDGKYYLHFLNMCKRLKRESVT